MIILSDTGIPCDDSHLDILARYQGMERRDEREGPCEDDCETTAPFISGFDHESPSFRQLPLPDSEPEWQTSSQRLVAIEEMLLLQRLYASDMDAILGWSRKAARRMKTRGL